MKNKHMTIEQVAIRLRGNHNLHIFSVPITDEEGAVEVYKIINPHYIPPQPKISNDIWGRFQKAQEMLNQVMKDMRG